MQLFNPPKIQAHSGRNTFTTLTQPFPTTLLPGDIRLPGASRDIPLADQKASVNIFIDDPTLDIDINEQGIHFEVPIFFIDENGFEEQHTIQSYPVTSDNVFAKKSAACRWVTVPYQTIGGSNNIDNPEYLDVGVIAFHGAGEIDRVEFFLNGSSKRIIVREPSHHPEKDITAYWIRIDASTGLEDSGDVWSTSLGSNNAPNLTTFSPHHELQAVVYPKFGKPRILAGKHNNSSTNMFIYNGIPNHWENSATKMRSIERNDSGIRSFYFSSNFNNSLFTGSVYVSADDGIDDLSRSGEKTQPMKSIDFAFRKLMRLKHKFYNNLPNEVEVNGDGEIGGGTIFLMELKSVQNKTLGHKIGFKNFISTPGALNVNPYNVFSKMRWITITPDLDIADDPITDPSGFIGTSAAKYKCKLKGYHLQKFDIFPTKDTGDDADPTVAAVHPIRIAYNNNIPTNLLRYKNCAIEGDWPYTEYMFGMGPELDGLTPTDPGNGETLVVLDRWKVKKGVLYKNVPTQISETRQEFCVLHSSTTQNEYEYSNTTAENNSGPISAPRIWLDKVSVNGGVRDSKALIEWAENLGMTYTVSFVGSPNFQARQDEIGTGWPTSVRKGIFSAVDETINYASMELPLSNPNSEGLTLTTPRIYVEPTQRTLEITNGLGFTLTNAGYTFDFCWAHPEFATVKGLMDNSFIVTSFITDSQITAIEQPADFAIDTFINSNLSRYEADVFRNTTGLVYQPLFYDVFVSRNYVNVGGAPLINVHSDVFQTIQGSLSFARHHIGVQNFIFYRFNNPSPRSKRYSDINARFGLGGSGPLDDIEFTSQWNISGRSDGNVPLFFYDPTKDWPGSCADGKTYQHYQTRHVKDLVFQDCLIFTETGSQQLNFTCLHENLLIRNCFLLGGKGFNQSNFSSGIDYSLNTPPTSKFGGTVAYYKTAIPNNVNWNEGNNDPLDTEVTAFDHCLVDNVQQYKTQVVTNPNTQKDRRIDTYDEPVNINVINSIGSNGSTKVGIRGFNRIRPMNHSTHKNPINLRGKTFKIISDLRYPFERDANGNAGPNQQVGPTAKIGFPVLSHRYQKAMKSYLATQPAGTKTVNPNSSTRGEWFTFHKTIPASTTNEDAPYGWMYSIVPHENFRYGKMPWPNGTVPSFLNNNRDRQAENPYMFFNFAEGEPTNTPKTLVDTKVALGTGWDPTLGTGKLNPQPTDPGYNPNQRGFRETVVFSYTNFDYDAIRSEFGEVLTPETLPLLQGEEEGGGGDITNPTPISNHPITISLTTTDIKKDISWASKDTFNGVTHGKDSFYSSVLQIPNYLERIEDVTDPADDLSIGTSRSNETSGNSTTTPNQGGVYVTEGTVDITLNTTIGAVNPIDVKNLATKFQTSVRTANGNTFAVILHGKTIPSTQFGEYKYVAPQSMSREEWEARGSPNDIDPEGLHYGNFYKEFAYIAFNSKESPITSQLTPSNQISFRKSPHHVYINFAQTEMDGLSLSNGATGLSYVDLVTGTPTVAEKISKLQALLPGITCSINSYSEFTSATKSNTSGTNPNIITCTNKTRKFVGLIENGNKIVLQGIAVSGSSSIFNSTSPRYEHNGSIGSSNQAYQRNPVDQTIPHYTIPPSGIDQDGTVLPPATINFRFLNPVSVGTKNLLAYKVPVGGTRLFGATPNIGITAGSYIRISNSTSNNGIYQVLSVADGIEGDTASNTKTSGSTEYQYLELSRAIVPEEQGSNIKIENVSHLPILHIKYRIPV
jgi:hypothetical protein